MQNSINLLSCSRSTLKSIRHSSDARNNKSTRRCSSTKRSMLLAAQRPSRWVLTWVIWRLYTCGICLLHRQTMCKEQDAQVAVKMQRRSHLHMLSSVPTTLPISRIRRTWLPAKSVCRCSQFVMRKLYCGISLPSRWATSLQNRLMYTIQTTPMYCWAGTVGNVSARTCQVNQNI